MRVISACCRNFLLTFKRYVEKITLGGPHFSEEGSQKVYPQSTFKKTFPK